MGERGFLGLVALAALSMIGAPGTGEPVLTRKPSRESGSFTPSRRAEPKAKSESLKRMLRKKRVR